MKRGDLFFGLAGLLSWRVWLGFWDSGRDGKEYAGIGLGFGVLLDLILGCILASWFKDGYVYQRQHALLLHILGSL